MIEPNWNHIRTFIHVIKLGTMSAAARVLRVAQPTIGRQIAALEADLGVVLFDRVGKEFRPTPLARDLAKHFSAMQDNVDEAISLVRNQSEVMEGEVTITVTDIVSLHIMPKILAEIAVQAPNLRVTAIAQNDLQDIARREADIAVRNTASRHENLISKNLGKSRAYLYAHQDYLDANGTPHSVAALRDHRLFAYDDIEKMAEQLASMAISIPVTAFSFASNDGNLVHRLVENGEGIGLLPDFLGDSNRKLTRILADQIAIPFDNWITTRSELRTNPRIRLVFDIVAEIVQDAIRMRENPSR